MLAHPNTLAKFNSWANERLHAACAALPSDQIALVSVRGLYESDESVIRRPLMKS